MRTFVDATSGHLVEQLRDHLSRLLPPSGQSRMVHDPIVRVEFRRALALRSEIRRAGWFY